MLTDDQKKDHFIKLRNEIEDTFRESASIHLKDGHLCAALESLLAGRALEMGNMDHALKFAEMHWGSLERIGPPEGECSN